VPLSSGIFGTTLLDERRHAFIGIVRRHNAREGGFFDGKPVVRPSLALP
jgi:hypothetical protein